MMRWCCTVFKTGAITKKIETTFKGAKQLISFQEYAGMNRCHVANMTENQMIQK